MFKRTKKFLDLYPLLDFLIKFFLIGFGFATLIAILTSQDYLRALLIFFFFRGVYN